MKGQRLLLLAVLTLTCCVSHKYELSNHRYLYKQAGEHYKRANIFVSADSIKVYDPGSSGEMVQKPGVAQYFLKRSFDVDVTTVLFKYRPGSQYLPRQLLTDFNGNVFVGYRLDRFKIRHTKTPFGNKKLTSHIGITMGGFAGIGSTAITPWTTNNQVTDEYNGFIVSRGLSVMIGFNTLTIGAGVGWDALTDRDKVVWIYQNKPWYGLTLGLNLN